MEFLSHSSQRELKYLFQWSQDFTCEQWNKVLTETLPSN